MEKRLLSLLIVFSFVLPNFSVSATGNIDYIVAENNIEAKENVQYQEQLADKQLEEQVGKKFDSDWYVDDERATDLGYENSYTNDYEGNFIYEDIIIEKTNTDQSTEELNDIKIDQDTISPITYADIESVVVGEKFNMNQYSLQDSRIEEARTNIAEENPMEEPTIDLTTGEQTYVKSDIETNIGLETEVNEDVLLEEAEKLKTEDNTLVIEETEYDQDLIEYLNNNENFNAADTSDETEILSDSEYQISTYATTAEETMTIDVVNNPYFGDEVNGAAVSLSTGSLTYEKTLISLPGRNDFNVDLTIQYNSDTAVVGDDTYTSLAYESVKSHNEFATGWSFDMTHLTKTRGRYGYYYSYPVLTLRDGSSYEVEYYTLDPSMSHTDVTFREYELKDIKASVTFDPSTHEADQIIIEYSDGLKEYIDEKSGDLVKSEDRFGNVITYEYTDLNYYRISFQDINAGYIKNNPPVGYNINLHTLYKITDSTGKEINIDYAVTEGNMGTEIDNIKVSVGDIVTATLDLENINEYNNMYILKSVTDGENLTTSFEYDKQLSHTFLFDDGKRRVNGTNVLLTKVIYPTGGYTDYEYTYSRRSLASSYNATSLDWYEVYKVYKITDSDDNSTIYEYNLDISGYPIYFPNEDLGGNIQNYQTIEHKRISDDSYTTTIYTFYKKNLIMKDVYDSAESSSTFVSSTGNYDGSVIIDGSIYRILISDNSLIIYKNNEQSDSELVSIYNFGYASASDTYLYFLNVKTSGNKIIVFLRDGSVSPNVTRIKVYDIVEKTWTDGDYIEGTSTDYYATRNYIYKYTYNSSTDTFSVTYYEAESGHWYTGNVSLSLSSSASVTHLGNDGIDKVYFIINYNLYAYSFDGGNIQRISDTTFSGTYTKAYCKENIVYLLSSNGIYVYDISKDVLSSVKTYPSDVTNTNTSVMGTDGNVYIIGNELSGGLQRIYYFSDDFYVHSYRLLDNIYWDNIVLGNNSIYIGCEKISLDKTTHLRNRTYYTYNDYDQLISSDYYVYYEGEMLERGTETWTYVNEYSAPLTYTDKMGNVTTYTYPNSTDDNIANLTYLYPATVTSYSNTDSPIVTTNTRSADNKNIISASTDYGDSVDSVEYTYDTTYPGNVLETVTYITKNGIKEETGRVTYVYGNEENNNSAYVSSTTAYNNTNSADFTGTIEQNQTVYYEYTNLGQLSREYNYIGETLYLTSYTYNNNGVLTKVVYPDNTFVEYNYTFGDENKLVTSYNGEYYTIEYYDELGRCIHTGESADGETLINTVTYGYKNGNVSYSYNSAGLYTYYYYDGYGRVIRIINTDNPIDGEYEILYDRAAMYNEYNINVLYITYSETKDSVLEESYDMYGRLVKTHKEYNEIYVDTEYHYDNRNNVIEYSDNPYSSIKYIYNNRNQLINVTDALGNSVVYEYDNLGNATKVTSGVNTDEEIAGTSVTYTYDSLSRVLSETNQLGNTEYYAYDSHNNLISSKDRNGVVTLYTYDNMNRLLNKTSMVSEDETESVSYIYDSLGNIIAMVDETGETEYGYNEYNLLSNIITPDSSSISYTYNSSNQLAGVLNYDGENILYTYDLMGNVSAITKDGATMAEYIYNDYNKIAELTYPGQGTTTYSYNTLKKISKIKFDFEDGTSVYPFQYQYEQWGNMNMADELNNYMEYGYDYMNRLSYDYEYPAEIFTQCYYDSNNNITGKELLYYEESSFEYVSFNGEYSQTVENVESHVINYTYNVANQLLTETETVIGDTQFTRTNTYSYDLNGNMTGKTISIDSVVIEDYVYTFDSFNRLKNIHATYYMSDGSAETFDYSYTYNGNNELSTVTTYKNGELQSTKKHYWDREYIIKDVTTTVSGAQTTTITSNYDDAVTAEIASITEEYGVEAFSVSESTITCTETIDGDNVQISGQIPAPDGSNQVSLIVSTDIDNVNENNIVYIDQTTSATSGTFEFSFTLPLSSNTASYGYIVGTDANTETYTGVINIEQGGNEDDDDDTDSAETTLTVKYYLGADGIFAQTDANGTSYLFKNVHGDTVIIVRNGSIVDEATYNPYGNPKESQEVTPYTYANYYYDSNLGLYYLRNRYYDPSIGRFISEDPIKDGNNWYVYCSGNPVGFVDPWGLLEDEDYKLSEDDYAKVLVLTELYNYYYELGQIDYAESFHKEAVEIRQQSKYNNIYNKGKYKDNYKYEISNNTTAINVEVLSSGMAWVLGGDATTVYQKGFDIFMDNSPEFDKCLSLIFSISKTYVDSSKYNQALSVLRGGDIKVYTKKDFYYGYTSKFDLPKKENTMFYFKRSGEIIAFETTTTYYKYSPITPQYTYTNTTYCIR